jgi:fructan beta-fructosidase
MLKPILLKTPRKGWLEFLLCLIFMNISFSQTLLEPYRPTFHFSPKTAWMNDPNGLVYYAGEYHLFYQYNPDDIVWGPMHWGHAVSPDLLHWEHLPIALYPDDLGTIFSGSAVIDWHNTAGFGKEAMVAIFTHATTTTQQQSIAYSTDKGHTWTKYQGNPVLEPPSRVLRDFRDPKVFWYGTQDHGHWVMALAAGSSILFFTSSDLKTWTSSGGFGITQGATCGVWETPDLFELPVNGTPVDKTNESRWVLMVGIGDCAPAGGSGQQYFVGTFDGQTFTNDNEKDTVLWADYGPDFYAGQSWSDEPKGRRIWAGWLNNWKYASTLPTSVWRGALTLPRELGLVQTLEGIRLTQTPISELESLRGESWHWENTTITETTNLLENFSGETFEILLEFEVDSKLNRVGFNLRVGNETKTTLGYDIKAKQLFFGRAESGETTFSKDFSLNHLAPLLAQDGIIKLHIILDRASVEMFANDGLVVMTEQIFPDDDATGLELFVESGKVIINKLSIWALVKK